MDARDLWNEWVEPFDLFISYARADNGPPEHMVTALVEAIEGDFARFAVDPPLKVFFDKRAILDGQHWEQVLKKGVRQSKVMLAVLSEAYFRSEWCRREWEEYVLVEQARTYPGEALTPIFVVAPPDLHKVVPASARDWWDDVTRRNAVVEIAPFWGKGRAALQERLVADRIARLGENVRKRAEHGRVLARVPRNIRGRNPNFVGRRTELAALRDALSRFEMAGVCAVNGVGGVGKSTVAREYAYLFRREYLGGQFELDLSTVSDARGVRPLLVGIARDYLKADIPTTLPEDAQYDRARAAFAALPPNHTALLVLDNLNEEAVGLVGAGGRDLLPAADKVHLLMTTRAEPRALGGMATVSLDVLPAAEALDLLFRYRAFGRNPDDPAYQRARAGEGAPPPAETDPPGDEWKAALGIANRLGRHALSVALVGAYLGSYPDLTYAQFGRELAEHGIGLALDAVGSDDKVRNLIQHPETLVGPLFERSVGRLGALPLRVLEYAAFLPPDLIPVAWLRALIEADADVSAELRPRPFQQPPWEETLRTLSGLQYLIGGPYARMHRVVQEVIRRRMSDAARAARPGGLYARMRRVVRKLIRRSAPDVRTERRAAVFAHVEALAVRCAGDLPEGQYADDREIEAVEAVAQDNADSGSPQIGRAAVWLVDHLMNLGRLRNARALALIAERILRAQSETDPASVFKQEYLGISFAKLGYVSAEGGELETARGYYERALAIAERLAGADPGSAQKQRDLGVSHLGLFELAAQEGDDAALAHLRAFVAVWGRLEAEGRLPNPNDQNGLRSLRQRLEEWEGGAS